MADLVARIAVRDLQADLPLDRLVDYLRLLRAEDGVSQQIPDDLAVEIAHMVFDQAGAAAPKRALERRCGLRPERVQIVIDQAFRIKDQAEKRSKGRAKKGQSGKAGRPKGAGREESPATHLAMNLMVLDGLSIEEASVNACLILAGREPSAIARNHVQFGDDENFEDDAGFHQLRKQADKVSERLKSQGDELKIKVREIAQDAAANPLFRQGLRDQVEEVRKRHERAS